MVGTGAVVTFLFSFSFLGEEISQNFDLKKNDFNVIQRFFPYEKK
jgi:hypothetical protein